MPPKAAGKPPAAKKASAAPQHGSYKDMIREAIVALKERNGSSRGVLKKYVLANNKSVNGAGFDGMFNRALSKGVKDGTFLQPKGSSGTVKLAKKDAGAKPAPKSAAAKSAAKEKKPASKKTTPAKSAGVKKAGTPKKTATKAKAATKAKPAKKPAASKTKTTKPAKAVKATKPTANTSTKRSKKTPAAAPAIIDEPKVLGKTKSGRVTKGVVKPANPSKGKKPAAKKTPVKKGAKATPKKTETPAPVAA